MERPEEVLPRRLLTATFPPTAASAIATTVVGTAIQGRPRRTVAAAKPATSRTAPASDRHDRLLAPQLQQAVLQVGEHGPRLRRLAPRRLDRHDLGARRQRVQGPQLGHALVDHQADPPRGGEALGESQPEFVPRALPDHHVGAPAGHLDAIVIPGRAHAPSEDSDAPPGPAPDSPSESPSESPPGSPPSPPLGFRGMPPVRARRRAMRCACRRSSSFFAP